MNEFISKNLFALIALLFSSISLFFTYNNYRKDRANLVTSSHFYKAHVRNDEKHDCSFSVKAVNSGRRPIILTSLMVRYDDGTESGDALGHPNGLTLKENEHYKESFEATNHIFFNAHDGEVRIAMDMWFADTLGKKHSVKDAKKNLKAYWDTVGVK